MFVTSDIFDLERAALSRGIEGWRERLVGGIAVHGTEWPGAEAAARFLTRAAKVCGLEERLPEGGYSLQWGEPSEQVDPASIAALAGEALPAASEAKSVYLQGSESSALGDGRVRYGGWVDAAPRMVGSEPMSDYPYRAFDGDFGFPLDPGSPGRGQMLLHLAAEILGADYGYYFVRDASASANFYARGFSAAVDRSRLALADQLEAEEWRRFVASGELWTGVWPQLRDIFAVNLLSERHLSADIEPIGHLDEWITAEPGRGRLEEMANGRALWTLTDAELHAVRPALWDVALMRSCMPRVYRDLPNARQRPDPETGRLPS